MGLSGIGAPASGQQAGRRYTESQTNPPVKEAFDVEEIQKSKKSVKTSEVDAAKLEAKEATKPDAALLKKPDVIRQMSKKDILDHLLTLGRQFNDHNENVVTTLLEYGLAASSDNFDSVERLAKGRKDASTVQSAVATISKGLEKSSQTVELFTKFFTNSATAKFSTETTLLQQVMQQFGKMMTQGQSVLSPGLYVGLSAILADFEETFKKLTQKASDAQFTLTAVLRKGLIKDVKTFTEFLAGLEQKIMANPEKAALAKPFLQQLSLLQGQLSSFIDNLTLQAVLSQAPKEHGVNSGTFSYWQIPNPMMQTPSHIELLIKKDKKRGERGIDSKKTRIVLRFETPNLGLLAAILDVQDRHVWATFHSDRPEVKPIINKMSADLRDRLEALDYEMLGFAIKEEKLNLKQLLLPRQSLDGLSRISAEI